MNDLDKKYKKNAKQRPKPAETVLMFEFDPIENYPSIRHVIPKSVVYKMKFNKTTNTVGQTYTTRAYYLIDEEKSIKEMTGKIVDKERMKPGTRLRQVVPNDIRAATGIIHHPATIHKACIVHDEIQMVKDALDNQSQNTIDGIVKCLGKDRLKFIKCLRMAWESESSKRRSDEKETSKNILDSSDTLNQFNVVKNDKTAETPRMYEYSDIDFDPPKLRKRVSPQNNVTYVDPGYKKGKQSSSQLYASFSPQNDQTMARNLAKKFSLKKLTEMVEEIEIRQIDMRDEIRRLETQIDIEDQRY